MKVLYFGKDISKKQFNQAIENAAEKQGLEVFKTKEGSNQYKISNSLFNIGTILTNSNNESSQETIDSFILAPSPNIPEILVKKTLNKFYVRTLLEVHSEKRLKEYLNDHAKRLEDRANFEQEKNLKSDYKKTLKELAEIEKKQKFLGKYLNSIRNDDDFKKDCNENIMLQELFSGCLIDEEF